MSSSIRIGIETLVGALNADNGNSVWSTPVGPGTGNTLGGIEWGTATDGQRIYVAIANAGHAPYALVPSGQQITWGAWSALDVATGKILWQTADPTVGAVDEGSVSVANGVMYAGSSRQLCKRPIWRDHSWTLAESIGKIFFLCATSAYSASRR